MEAVGLRMGAPLPDVGLSISRGARGYRNRRLTATNKCGRGLPHNGGGESL
jgi:hypothetical protein